LTFAWTLRVSTCTNIELAIEPAHTVSANENIIIPSKLGVRVIWVASMNVPDDLKYTKDHEWARKEPSGVRVGITDHAQQELTDIVYVGLPKAGASVQKGKPLCVVESIKATNDVFAAVSGTVVDMNSELTAHPELVNKEPYSKGWMVVIKPSNEKEFDELMTPEKYKQYLSSMGGKH